MHVLNARASSQRSRGLERAHARSVPGEHSGDVDVDEESGVEPLSPFLLFPIVLFLERTKHLDGCFCFFILHARLTFPRGGNCKNAACVRQAVGMAPTCLRLHAAAAVAGALARTCRAWVFRPTLDRPLRALRISH